MNFYHEVARGNVPGAKGVNKFGRNPDVDTGTIPEDVWDGAAASPIWVPPTQARVHNIASNEAADASAGTGARTVMISGLVAWDKPEESETVSLDGTTPVATTKSYVLLHRMRCLTFGSGATNAGNITATAQTDGTVTAQITAGFGQTLMAIYGVPSVEILYMTKWYISFNNAQSATNNADCQLLVNERPDQSDSGYVIKHHLGLFGSGSTRNGHRFEPDFPISGPALIKVQVEDVGANNTDISAGFDGVLQTYSHVKH